MSEASMQEHEMLDEGDRETHAYIAARAAMLATLEAEAAKIRGARDLWMERLSEKYGLAAGDTITPDYVIHRATPPTPLRSVEGTG
jgi:hypothetical protein